MSSLFDPINSYCERSGSGLFDEPINAISNISFFIAAFVLYRKYRKAGHKDPQVIALIILLALIGCGSTLFHTFANGLTMIGDVLPITLFTFMYLWLALRRLVEMNKTLAVRSLLAFTMFGVLAPHAPESLQFNGSIAYFPCLGALFIIGAYLYQHKHISASLMLRAASWFTVSILYRSLDIQLCSIIPTGTHFIWHTINGWVLYLLVCALLKRNEMSTH